MERKCNECDQKYMAENRYLNRGQGLFCSHECASISNGKNRKAIKNPNVTCAYCNVDFYKPPNKLKGSKSGLYFCCRTHKDLAQRIGGISEIQPSHYGERLKSYRTFAFRELDHRCLDCGWDKYEEVLHVHHVDENRKNNDISNLIIVCPTCHEVRHFKAKSAKWSKGSALAN